MIQNALFIISLSTVAVMNMPADGGVPCNKITTLGVVLKETSCLTQSVAAHQCQHVKIHSKPQKKVIRIMMGCGRRDSCRKLFAELGILTLPSQYIFCLLQFVVKNRKLFSLNKDLHSINTR